MKKGAILILLSVAVLAGYLFFHYKDDKMPEENEVKATMAKTAMVTANPEEDRGDFTTDNNPVDEPEDGLEKETQKESLVQGENGWKGIAAEIKAVKLDKEVLHILGVSRKRLEKELKIYANGCGFPNATEAVYGGETIISHSNQTVSVAFYMETPQTDIYKFYAVYNKSEDTFSFETW